MDYPKQTRLKVLGRVEIHENDAEASSFLKSFPIADRSDVVERVIFIHIEAFDWNCPQHITPRYTLEEFEQTLAPVREELAHLQEESAKFRVLPIKA